VDFTFLGPTRNPCEVARKTGYEKVEVGGQRRCFSGVTSFGRLTRIGEAQQEDSSYLFRGDRPRGEINVNRKVIGEEKKKKAAG